MDSKKLFAVAAVPAVMAFGALGFASQQGHAQPNSASQTQAVTQKAKAPQAENTKATDTDNVQQGDQTSPDKPGKAEVKEASGPDKDNIQQGGGAQVQQGDQNAPDNQEGVAESNK